jgi:hypothetical protein
LCEVLWLAVRGLLCEKEAPPRHRKLKSGFKGVTEGKIDWRRALKRV